MKPIQIQASERGATGVSWDVASHGSVRLAADGLRQLRQQLILPDGKPLPASFLKHADDQTVAGLAAVLQAIGRFDRAGSSFTDWGVLAAPRFLGRSTMVAALQRFGEEGAWGVSPHLIPHRSLHSLSGTISQALQVRGPNYGVGGGPDCASEVFLAVAAMLGRSRLPGLWVVLTGWQPEPMPGQAAASTCHAAALALRSAQAGQHGWQLRLTPDASPADEAQRICVESLTEVLTTDRPLPASAQWTLDGGGRLELEQVGAAACAYPSAERRAG